MADLNYKKMGQGEPLIILHGLYGFSDNWLNIGQQLADKFTVYILDQRNHGRSPHTEKHTYPEMREDLTMFMNKHQIEKANIIGHSMGGKTAAYFALKYPEKVKRLIVVDILPTPYKSDESESPQLMSHKKILTALRSVDINSITSLKEADEQLEMEIPYKKVRQFLLKNLKRDENNKFYWLLNLETLSENLPEIMGGINPDEITYDQRMENFPVLFIKGEHSDYIKEEDKQVIEQLFPKAVLTIIKGAGHWVHAEKRQQFLSVVEHFLET